MNDFTIFIQNWSFLGPINAFFIILKCIKYIYRVLIKLNAKTHPNNTNWSNFALKSTMILVNYFDLQIYNFLKLPVYNLQGVHP